MDSDHDIKEIAGQLRAAFGALATRRLGRPARVLESATSTMDVAVEWARATSDPAPHGAIVAAVQQTRGRGRHARIWDSPPGLGLYCSLILRPEGPADGLGALSPATGLALCEALDSLLGGGNSGSGEGRVAVKWPNDVRIEGRKVAGVLAQAETRGGGIRWIVIGIGVNVGHRAEDFPQGLRRRSSSMALAAQRPISLSEVVAAIVPALEARWSTVLQDGFAPLVEAWNARCDHLGRWVEVGSGPGAVVGRVQGIDHNGCLRLADGGGGERVVGAGELVEIDVPI